MRIDLFSNKDGAASGSPTNVAFGGRYLAVAQGTFDSATVTCQMLGPDGATYITIPGFSLTAAGSAVVYLPSDATVRGVIAGGTSPTGIYVSLYRMPEE